MIAGALEFTLGLQGNQFLNELGLSGKGLLSFLGLAGSIEGAFHKMWAAVEKGGNLQDLATRTNTSVRSLYSLQQAFEQIGASADSAAPLILKMQRSLVDKEGGNILRSLGLDPAQLRGKESVDQINAVADAIARLNPSQQSAAAFGLFGREGAATVLQIARSGREFRDAVAATRTDADIWQKTAARFDQIGDKVKEIQGHIKTMFALVAGALVAAFDQGGFEAVAGLITDMIVTGIQGALSMVIPVLQKLGEIILRTLSPYMQKIQQGMEQSALTIIMAVSGENERELELEKARGELNKRLIAAGRNRIGRSTSSEDQWREAGTDPLMLGNVTMEEIIKNSNENLKARWQRAAERFKSLGGRMADLISGLPTSTAGAAAGAAQAAGPFKSQLSDVTALERMGAAFGGLGRGFGQDHARATAENTRKSADLLKNIYDKLSPSGETSFANT